MFLYLCCIFYFVVAGFGINDTYIHFSDDETDRYFPSNTINVDVNDDFEFPWTHESEGLQTGILTSQEAETIPSEEPEPLSLKNIIELFVQQYGGGITNANTWHAVVNRPDALEWDNLCYQTWHKIGEHGFNHIKCKSIPSGTRSLYSVFVPGGNSFKPNAKFIKCICPNVGHYVRSTFRNNTFYVTQHSGDNYFTLFCEKGNLLIIYGYVMNVKFPFTKTLNTTRRYYYKERAEYLYKHPQDIK